MRNFFGIDDDFVRALPERHWRSDIIISTILAGLAILELLTYRFQADFLDREYDVEPLPANYPAMLAMILAAGVLVALRRRWPVMMLVLATGVHFILSGTLFIPLSHLTTMQVLYFVVLYSAVAWARKREALMLAAVVVLLAMVVWITIDSVINISWMRSTYGSNTTVLLISTVLVNLAYFGTATWLGRDSWLKARGEHELVTSLAVIEDQSRQLADQAVLGERVRIARELHDSMAHHVALIGVHAAAARLTIDKRPVEAAQALQSVEQSSRQAVAEIQAVVGSLRDADAKDSPQPNLDLLPTLFAENQGLGLQVSYTSVGSQARFDQLSPTYGAALFRVIQEALTNVRRHSTASAARVTVRLGSHSAEAEIVDDGQPVVGSSGSRLGQVGIRERISALGGDSKLGPRSERGYRVWVTIPVEQSQ
ncbi:MAG: sensor histidine kinase [Arachnia sp.]